MCVHSVYLDKLCQTELLIWKLCCEKSVSAECPGCHLQLEGGCIWNILESVRLWPVSSFARCFQKGCFKLSTTEAAWAGRMEAAVERPTAKQPSLGKLFFLGRGQLLSWADHYIFSSQFNLFSDFRLNKKRIEAYRSDIAGTKMEQRKSKHFTVQCSRHALLSCPFPDVLFLASASFLHCFFLIDIVALWFQYCLHPFFHVLNLDCCTKPTELPGFLLKDFFMNRTQVDGN